MESDLEPTPDFHESEPKLEIVEGDAQEASSNTAIIPNAFESVLEKAEQERNPVDREDPPYKNRALIGVACLVVGIFAGRLTTQPKVETKYIEKEVPVVQKETTTAPTAAPVVPKVDKAFRELNDVNEFDPWEPMNGGFPMPPKDTQASIVGRSGTNFSQQVPPSLQGNITPVDPGEISGPLPAANGAGTSNPLPQNPQPGGKPTEGTGSAKISAPERYISIAMNGPEPTKGQASVAAIASALGGSSRTFTHMNEDATLDSQGILIIVPSTKLDEAKQKIEALGGATVDGSVEGNVADQQSRIQAAFVTRLAKLRAKQKDLLVDFLDDAPIVKQFNEAIDFETRAVSATRLPGNLAGKSVIRVLLK